MTVPNESDFLTRWEPIFCKDELWIYFLSCFYSIGHGLLFQIICFSLSCINSSLSAPILAVRHSMLIAWYKLCVLRAEMLTLRGGSGLAQAGVKLSNQSQQLQNRSANSSSTGLGMGNWKDGDQGVGTSEETFSPPNSQVTSDLAVGKNLSWNGRWDSP